MQALRASLALGLVPFGFLAACSSPHPMEWEGAPPRSDVGSRAGSYAIAQSAPALEQLLAEDLQAGAAARALDGLEAFVADNVRAETTARAWLIWSEVKPVTMLQFGGARGQMTAAKSLEDMLQRQATDETRASIDSLRSGDLERVRKLRDHPMGIFHGDTAALSNEIRPYAKLADGVLRYQDLAASGTATDAELAEVLAVLNEAQTGLSQFGDAEASLLADAAAAQSLERSGQLDAAAEYWMRVANSPSFDRQPELTRNLVAARVKTHSVRLKERLFLEVEEAHRAELRAMSDQHEAQVQSLERNHTDFADWARAGLGDAQARLASLAAEDVSLREELSRAARSAAERDAQLRLVAEGLDETVTGLDARVAALAGVTDEQRADLDRLAAMDLEQRAKIEALSALSEAQREEVYRLNGASDAQRADLERLREAAQLRQEALEDLGERVDDTATGVARVERAVGDVGAEADARSAATEEAMDRARADLASYRAAVDELVGGQDPRPLTDALAGELSEAGDGSDAVERLSVEALPDLFGALAQAGEGLQSGVSALILPRD